MSIHAINARTLGISEYTGLTPVKVFSHGDRVYILTSTQLLELTGSNDDGVNIDCSVRGGKLAFGSYDEKRVSRAYVKDQYANELLLTTYLEEVDADQSVSETSYEYTIPGLVGARQHARAERLRRDLKTVDWGFEVANVSGGGMSLKGLSVEVEGIEVDV